VHRPFLNGSGVNLPQLHSLHLGPTDGADAALALGAPPGVLVPPAPFFFKPANPAPAGMINPTPPILAMACARAAFSAAGSGEPNGAGTASSACASSAGLSSLCSLSAAPASSPPSLGLAAGGSDLGNGGGFFLGVLLGRGGWVWFVVSIRRCGHERGGGLHHHFLLPFVHQLDLPINEDLHVKRYMISSLRIKENLLSRKET